MNDISKKPIENPLDFNCSDENDTKLYKNDTDVHDDTKLIGSLDDTEITGGFF